ncbi:CHAT domain-containing protein, partial [bacterium]|nr:CHAT domain-containing protein [bacterium]
MSLKHLPALLLLLASVSVAEEAAADSATEVVEKPVGLELSAFEQLTTHSAHDSSPSLRPGLSLLAFVSDRSGNEDIWVNNLRTGTTEQLTTHTAADYQPAWDTSGETVFFVSTRDDPDGEIYSINTITNFPRRLTEYRGRDESPAVSPDGRLVVFARTEERSGATAPACLGEDWNLPERLSNLYQINADGSDLKRITDSGGTEPTWSPDGEWLCYVVPGVDRSALVLRRLSDGYETVLVNEGSYVAAPRWKPAGLVFTRFALDTNNDGRMNSADNAQVCFVSAENLRLIQDGVYDGVAATDRLSGGQLPWRRVTAVGSWNGLADLGGVNIFFSSDRSGNGDLWSVPINPPPISDDPATAFRAARGVIHDPAGQLLAFSLFVDRFAAEDDWAARAQLEYAHLLESPELGFPRQAAVERGLVAERWPSGVVGVARSELAALRERWSQAVSYDELPSAERYLTEGAGTETVAPTLLDDCYELAGRVEETVPEAACGTLSLAGEIHTYQREYELALADYEAASYLGGDFSLRAEADYGYAETLRRLRRTEEAENHYLYILLSYPAEREWLFSAGDSFIEMKLADTVDVERLDALQNIIVDYAPYVELAAHARFLIGAELAELEQSEEAIMAYRAVLEDYPSARLEGAAALFEIARLERELRRPERAGEALKRISEEYADLEAGLPALMAQRQLRRVLLEDADGYRRRNDYQRAEALIRRALDNDYDDPAAHRALVKLFCEELGRRDRILWEYRERLAVAPDDGLAHYAVGLALTYKSAERGETVNEFSFTEAERLLRKAVELRFDLPQAWYTLGWLELTRAELEREKGNNRQAGEALERSLEQLNRALAQNDVELDPNFEADICLLLGNANYLFNNPARALGFYSQRDELATLRYSDAVEARFEFNYARSARHVDDYPTALTHFRRAIELFEAAENEVGALMCADGIALVRFEQEDWDAGVNAFVEVSERYEALALAAETESVESPKMGERIRAAQLALAAQVKRGYALRNVGLCYFFNRYYPDAIDYFTRALTINDTLINKSQDEAEAGLLNFQVTAGLAGDASESAQGFDPIGERQLLYTFIAKCYLNQGDHRQAITFYQQRLELFEERRATEIEEEVAAAERSKIYSQLGKLSYQVGNRAEAIDYYLLALAESETAGAERGRIVSLTNLTELAMSLDEELSARTYVNEDNAELITSVERLLVKLNEIEASRVEIEDQRLLARVSHARGALLRLLSQKIVEVDSDEAGISEPAEQYRLLEQAEAAFFAAQASYEAVFLTATSSRQALRDIGGSIVCEHNRAAVLAELGSPGAESLFQRSRDRADLFSLQRLSWRISRSMADYHRSRSNPVAAGLHLEQALNGVEREIGQRSDTRLDSLSFEQITILYELARRLSIVADDGSPPWVHLQTVLRYVGRVSDFSVLPTPPTGELGELRDWYAAALTQAAESGDHSRLVALLEWLHGDALARLVGESDSMLERILLPLPPVYEQEDFSLQTPFSVTFAEIRRLYESAVALAADKGEWEKGFELIDRQYAAEMAGIFGDRELTPHFEMDKVFLRNERYSQEQINLLATISSAYGTSLDPGADAILQELRRGLEAEQRNYRYLIEEERPLLRSLVGAYPLKTEEIQATLRPGEAMLSFFFAENNCYGWLLTPDSLTGRPLELDRAEAAKLVEDARNHPALLPLLYQKLIAPFEPEASNLLTLYLVPDGALWEVPWTAALQQSRSDHIPAAVLLYSPSDLGYAYEQRNIAYDRPLLAIPEASVDDRYDDLGMAVQMRRVDVKGELLWEWQNVDELLSAATSRRLFDLTAPLRLDESDPLYNGFFVGAEWNEVDRDYLDFHALLGANIGANTISLSAMGDVAYAPERLGRNIGVLLRGFYYAGIPSVVLNLNDAESRPSRYFASLFNENLLVSSPAGAFQQAKQETLAEYPDDYDLGAMLLGFSGFSDEEAVAFAEEHFTKTVYSAQANYEDQRYSFAWYQYLKAAGMAEQLGDPASKHKLWSAAVAAAGDDGELSIALTYQQRLYEEAETAVERARALQRLSRIHAALGELPDALEANQSYLLTLAEVGDSTVPALAEPYLKGYWDRALLQVRLYRYDEAREEFEQALLLAVGSERTATRAQICLDLSNLHYANLEQPEQALRYAEEAETLYWQLDDSAGRASALAQLGFIHTALGKADHARQLHQEGLTLLLSSGGGGSEQTRLDNLYGLTKAYWNLRDYEQSAQICQSTLEELGEEGNLRLRSLFEGAWSLSLLGLQQDEAALEAAQRSLTLAEEADYLPELAAANANLALIHRLSGSFNMAELHFSRAYMFDQAIGYQLGMEKDLRHLAITAELAGDLDEAISYHRRYLALDDSETPSRRRALGYYDLARLTSDAAAIEQATSYSRQLGLTELPWRIHFVNEEYATARQLAKLSISETELTRLRDGLFTTPRDLYGELIHRAAEVNEGAEALTLLLELHALTEERPLLSTEVHWSEGLGELLDEELEAAEELIVSPGNPTHHDLLVREIVVNYPAFAGLVGDVSAEELRSRLDSHQAALAWFVDGDVLYSWLITADGVELQRFSETAITTTTRSFLAQLTNRLDEEEFTRLGEELSLLLLEPWAAQLREARLTELILLPDGVLKQLSFALLPWQDRQLIDRFALSYSGGAGWSAPSEREQDEVLLSLATEELTFATREARGIANLFPLAAEPLTGKAAKESSYYELAGNARYLHLACHASLAKGDPLASSLLLNADRGWGEDGRLTAGEIIGTPLSCELAVLSSCQTALGSNGGGDSLLSLA